MGDQGGVVGDLGLGRRRPGLGDIGAQLDRSQGGAQRRRLLGTELKPFLHKEVEHGSGRLRRPLATAESERRRPYPAFCGRQVSWGLRQSMPSRW